MPKLSTVRKAGARIPSASKITPTTNNFRFSGLFCRSCRSTTVFPSISTPSWGNILRGGRGCLTTAPHIATISGLLIFIAVIGFNLVGDGIRDVMDPKMKK